MVLVSDDEKEIELKAVDLLVSVKQLLGLNAQQLDFLKKAVPVALAFGLFVYQVATSTQKLDAAILAALPALLAAIGVEGADKLSGTKDKDEGKTTLV